jgi:hypothetical protein
MIKNTEFETCILKFIYYNLINNNIDLSEDYLFSLTHPENFFNQVGIHKDDSVYTCITYINSPLSTEIAFDTKTINLEWLKCSPLFRFDTSGEITTLCFSDTYILHTAPIYEEEGKEPREVNIFDDYETMIDVKDPNDGKSYLKFGNYVYSDGEYRDNYLEIKPINTFLKQEHRKKIKKPNTRQILASFFEKIGDRDRISTVSGGTHFFRFGDPVEINVAELQNYKIDLVKEKIELTEDNIETIRTTEKLGIFQLAGGKKKYKNIISKRIRKTHKRKTHKRKTHKRKHN